MLLSNNHASYPFLSFKTEFWKVKYYNYYTTFSDIYNSDIPQKKHGAFHYLDYDINERLTIGLFEGIIWQAQDENYEEYSNAECECVERICCRVQVTSKAQRVLAW